MRGQAAAEAMQLVNSRSETRDRVPNKRPCRDTTVVDLTSSEEGEQREGHDEQQEDDFYEMSLSAAEQLMQERERQAPAGSRKRLWGSFDDGCQREPPSRRAYASMEVAGEPAVSNNPFQGMPELARPYPFGPILRGSNATCHRPDPPTGVSPSRLLAPLMLDDHPFPMQHQQHAPPAYAPMHDAPRAPPATATTDTSLFGDSPSSSRRAMLHQRLMQRQGLVRDRAGEPPMAHGPFRGPPAYPSVSSMAAHAAEEARYQRLMQEQDKHRAHQESERMQRRMESMYERDRERERERERSLASGSMVSIRLPSGAPHVPAVEPPQLPPPARVTDPWRRTRSARTPAPSSSNNASRHAWSSMAALEPLLPFSLMMDDVMPDFDHEMDQILEHGMPLLPPPPDFSRRHRGGEEGPSSSGRPGADGPGRSSMDGPSEGGPEEFGIRGALRRARAAYGALPPGGSSDADRGVPWGMYRAGMRASGMEERGSGSPGGHSARSRHLGGWGSMPPGFGLGGVYGDLLASAMRSGLPAHLLLSDRDFTPDDYEVLCRLDDNVENRKGATQQEIDAIPTQVVGRPSQAGSNAAKAASADPNPDLVILLDDSQQEGATSSEPAAPTAALPVAEDCQPGSGRCTICLDDWAEGSIVRRMSCTHCFHKDCVDVWLKQKASCPICQRCLRDTA